MDNNQKMFHQVYTSLKYPPEFEEYLFVMLMHVAKRVGDRLKQSQDLMKKVDLTICLKYLAEEHLYNMNLIEKNFVNQFMKSKEYSEHLIMVTTDKVFFNEYLEYNSVALISRYNPLISQLILFLNFVINKYGHIPPLNNLSNTLVLDILRKGFFMTKSVVNLLCDGFETEAFSTWRTIHEVECVAKILAEKPYLADTYYLHMKYNSIYRGAEQDKDKVDAFYAEVKGKLKQWDLKSKDFKKFLEYGWLYDIPNWKEEYPELKLNFRKGLEYVAGLTSYSDLYEASSEIAHGSPLLIFSSKQHYLNLSITCLYETFIRMEDLFTKVILSIPELDSSAYVKMRNTYLPEINKNLIKLKLANDYAKLSENEKKS
jgi:hypothetical protein